MRHEETEALPMIQRTLTTAEHARPARRRSARTPPDGPGARAVGARRLPEEGRERMFAMAGPAYRLLAKLFVPRYERREKVAFRYL